MRTFGPPPAIGQLGRQLVPSKQRTQALDADFQCVRGQEDSWVRLEPQKSRQKIRVGRDLALFEAVAYPKDAVDFKPAFCGMGPQPAIAGQKDGVLHALCKRQAKAIVE